MREQQSRQQQQALSPTQVQQSATSYIDMSLPLSSPHAMPTVISAGTNFRSTRSRSGHQQIQDESSLPESLRSEEQIVEDQMGRAQSARRPQHDQTQSYYPDYISSHIVPESLDGSNLPKADGDRFLRLYYEHFHNAHPFLVPSLAFSSRNYPHHLRRIVHFAGSHYAPSGPSSQLRAEVAADLIPMSGNSTCMVQSLLVYSIILLSSNELDLATETFTRCAKMAIELGMHRRDFVALQHVNTPIEAESLRRTWWEIYVTDISMAIPPESLHLRCSDVAPEVDLPCEEADYTGRSDIPSPHTILEFKRRVLSGEDLVFSSIGYRVEAATILGRVLLLNQLRNVNHDHIQSIENALLSWSNHLPAEKFELVDGYGNVDEMMFQAHTIIALASMLLHLPRSNLCSLLGDAKDPFLPFAQIQPLSTSMCLIQGIKATDASRRISDCISLCPNISKHTPFIIPVIAICGFIQLATSQGHSDECFEHHYNRVTLVLGCLRSARRIWRLAQSSYDRVRCCASSLISERMDRMNALPLSRITANVSSPSLNIARQGVDLTLESPDHGNADLLLPGLDPHFLDAVCYDYSLFSSLPDFHNA